MVVVTVSSLKSFRYSVLFATKRCIPPISALMSLHPPSVYVTYRDLGTIFLNSTLVTSTPASTSPVSSIRLNSGTSSLPASMNSDISFAGSRGAINASLGIPRTIVWQNIEAHEA